MATRLLIVICLAFSACATKAPEISGKKPSPSDLTKPAGGPKPPLASYTETPETTTADTSIVTEPVLAPGYYSLNWRDVSISAVCYDDRKFQLRVADQPGGCGSLWMDAKSAAKASEGIAAINGGFFTPEGKPLGILVEDGIKRGHINSSSLGAGFYISSTAGSAILRRGSGPLKGPTLQANHLLQSGPLLVEEGAVVGGLSNERMRRRSFLAWNGKNHWIMGQTRPTTLHALAKALLDLPIDDFHIDTALNLDGGTSSDFWVGAKIPNGNRSHRSVFNKPVRNYLVLTAR